ncbi:MAG: 2,3-bisphosphoglycerate-dependent phosphoglycerate mutase [Planctomycetota bacterium]
MRHLVLLRHGESEWNAENRMTGWADVGLTETGVAEARRAGRLLRASGQEFDVVHTSLLKRALKSMFLALEELDLLWLPVERAWQLNERHYGRLTGVERARYAEPCAGESSAAWCGSYEVPPPAMGLADPGNPASDRRYDDLSPSERPRTESLKDAYRRIVAYWEARIRVDLEAGRRVLVVGHGTTLGLLAKFLDGTREAEVVEEVLPAGRPLVYELRDDLSPLRRYELGVAADARPTA